MPTLPTLLAASTVPTSVIPLDEFAQFGPVWLLLAGVVGAILVILAGTVKSLLAKKNGNGSVCKAAELGPVLQGLQVSIGTLGVKLDGFGNSADRLADAVTEHRLATATGLTVLGTRTEQLTGDLKAIQATLGGLPDELKQAIQAVPARRRAAGK